MLYEVITALTAYWEGNPAGIVSLRRTDLHTRAHVGPWLSALLVDPAYRHLGVGRDLVAATLALAGWLGYPEVWLFTPDRRSFYEELGWERVEPLAEREAGRAEAVVIEQLEAVIDTAGVDAFASAVVAYEPVWAVGTGVITSYSIHYTKLYDWSRLVEAPGE